MYDVAFHIRGADCVSRNRSVASTPVFPLLVHTLVGHFHAEVMAIRRRDNSPAKSERVQFSSAILPPYLRRS
jgi:hypothetical protein